jgi:prepilin-type N-terminal cleavage/methylation domain-containing protein
MDTTGTHNTGSTQHHRHRDDRGFTLVEILIAIALVGILSAVAVVGISSLTSKGANSACTASADAARAATAIHFTSTGALPDSLTAMVTSGALTLPQGVTIDSTGLVATGDGWTLSMTPGNVVTFTCSTGTTAARPTTVPTTVATTVATTVPTTVATTVPTTVATTVPTAVPVAGGLVTRLDASSLTAMFQDSTGATAATTAGQRVCRWADNSGTSTHAVQPSTAMCPMYGSDAKGGYLDFNANGFLTVTPTLSPDFTVFVVAQSDTPTWNAYAWLMSGRGANGLILHAVPGTRSIGFYVVAGGATYLGGTTVGDVTVPHIYKLSATGSTPTGYYGVDSVSTAYTMSAGTRTAGAVQIRLGSDDLADRLGDGKYREVLIYNRALSTAEMSQVEAYLTTKWRLN